MGACLHAKPLPAPDSGRGFAGKPAPTRHSCKAIRRSAYAPGSRSPATVHPESCTADGPCS
ncbi:hypothetical protein B0684_06205 [Thioalkalivibrio versutus]|nr:hypothetical protein B0684_06205 [Thioalkalivibrio versutus]